jgi:hypothetical protein
MTAHPVIVSGLLDAEGSVFAQQVSGLTDAADVVVSNDLGAFILIPPADVQDIDHARKMFVTHFMGAASNPSGVKKYAHSRTGVAALMQQVRGQPTIDLPKQHWLYVRDGTDVSRVADRLAGLVIRAAPVHVTAKVRVGGVLTGPAVDVVPEDKVLNDAGLQRKARLLRSEEWLDAAAVHMAVTGVRGETTNMSRTASRLRSERKIFAVRDNGSYLHPAVQFDMQNGRVRPVVRKLLALLPPAEDGWGNVFWLYQPRRSLDGKRPADLLATEPDLVLKAAKEAFGAPDDVW